MTASVTTGKKTHSEAKHAPGKSHWYIYAYCLLLSGVICSISWPGFMNYDGIHTLEQARVGFSDPFYPALMIYIQGLCDRIYAGPGLMFAIQTVVYMLAWGQLVRLCRFAPIISIITLTLVAFFPPILGPSLSVFKDVGMMAFFFAATVLMLTYRSGGRRSTLWCALGCIFVGSGYRLGALAPVAPLVVWWSFLFIEGHRHQLKKIWRQVLALTATLMFALTGTFYVLNNYQLPNFSYRVPKFKYLPGNIFDITELFDLVGMSYYSGEILIPPEFIGKTQSFEIGDVRAVYHPEHLNLSFDSGEKRLIRCYTVPSTRMQELWISAVTKHPLAYLRHRLAVLQQLLSIGRDVVFIPAEPGIIENKLGVSFTPSPLTAPAVSWILWSAGTPLSAPWVYYTLALPLLWWHVRRRAWCSGAVIAGISSAFLYLASMIPTVAEADLRYHCWSLAAILGSLVLTISLIPKVRLKDRA